MTPSLDKQLPVYLTEGLYERLRLECFEQRVPMAAYIRSAVRVALAADLKVNDA